MKLRGLETWNLRPCLISTRVGSTVMSKLVIVALRIHIVRDIFW